MNYVDVAEWTELGARLAICGRDKYDEILEALRKIVDAYELVNEGSWLPAVQLSAKGAGS